MLTSTKLSKVLGQILNKVIDRFRQEKVNEKKWLLNIHISTHG